MTHRICDESPKGLSQLRLSRFIVTPRRTEHNTRVADDRASNRPWTARRRLRSARRRIPFPVSVCRCVNTTFDSPAFRASRRSTSRTSAAIWWGPKDFTNTFKRFDFKPGGRWVFVMHGPNGADYPDGNVFREVQPDTRIVTKHVEKPWYRPTVTFTARGDQAHLAWVQEFQSPEFAAKMRPLCEPPTSRTSTDSSR
jgi:uncharacterized protein YndB with AHSA1/START domain